MRNGELPFWSPYLYLGYPVYGDMQSGAWNPIVWLFSLVGRYDITFFHFENLVYIFLAGVGMYKLAFYRTGHTLTALVIGASYMLSGFMLSGQLINWLAAAAFIPFVILYYARATTRADYADGLKTGIALYMLLVAGYPSFFILTVYGLAAIFLVRILERRKWKVPGWKAFALQHAVMLLVLSALSLPAIISYLDLLPYYQRGSGTAFTDAIHNSFEAQHLLSLLFPSAIHATDVISATDVTCRNVYAGILIIPLVVAFPPARKARNILLIAVAILAFLFSLGDATPFRKITYDILPLLDTFRHPSQARLFMMIALLLLAAPGLKKLLDHPRQEDLGKMFRTTMLFAVCILVITIIALTQSGVIRSIPGINGGTAGIKQLIESVSLHDVVAINGLLQLFFLCLALWWLKQKKPRAGWLACIMTVNLAVFAQFILPVTFVSQTPSAVINKFLHASPKGFPVDQLQHSLAENSRNAFDHFETAGLAFFYNKKVGISRNTNTPAFLTQQDSFLANPFLYEYVASQPFVYTATGTIELKDSLRAEDTSCRFAFADHEKYYTDSCTEQPQVWVTRVSANSIHLETNSETKALLVLTQNYHRHWKATVDRSVKEILKVNTAFMGIGLDPGVHYVRFEFIPTNSILAFRIQVAFILLIVLILIARWVRGRKRKAVNP